MEQRITRNVTEFTAGGGLLDVKGTVKQVGSLIDGNFTLNSGGYEHEDLKDVDKSRNIGINMTFTPGVTEIYRNGRLTGEAAGGVAVGTRLNYSETDYVTKVKATIGEATRITVNGKSADLSSVNRDAGNMVEVEKDKKLRPAEYDLGTEYWATNYGREKFNNDVAQAKNKVERVSEIMKAVIENEDKNIGLYYRDRIDYEKTRDDLERAGLSDGFVLDETIAQMFAEIAAQQNIDDLQIISLSDPNIKEIVGAEAIAGRAYHVGNGKIVIVAENLQDFADAMGTIAEEGRHIYHRNNNGLEDSEDYASFYGRQFERYFNKRAKDTPLYMIGSNLAYNAGQLGNDWEDQRYDNREDLKKTHLNRNGRIDIEYFKKVYGASFESINNRLIKLKSKNRGDALIEYVIDEAIGEIDNKTIKWAVRAIDIAKIISGTSSKSETDMEKLIMDFAWARKATLQAMADEFIYRNERVARDIAERVEIEMLKDYGSIISKGNFRGSIVYDLFDNPDKAYNKDKKYFDRILRNQKTNPLGITSRELINMVQDSDYYYDHGRDPDFFFEAGMPKFRKPQPAKGNTVKSVGERSYLSKLKKMKLIYNPNERRMEVTK